MWKTNAKIGFDDRLLILIMIPICAFIIPYIFFGRRFDEAPYLDWSIYRGSLIITAVIWIGNRFILIWSRTRYPNFAETRKRIIIQSCMMLVFTLLANNFLAYLLDVCNLGMALNVSVENAYTILLNSNFATLLCTLSVVAIYESIYFMNELKKSVEEKELLKQESLKAQLSALKTQVNPHFLFNNLNTLSAVIPDDPQKAIDFVQRLSKVYRHILEVRDNPCIPLKEELDVMKAYAFLLQTRFGDNLHININIAPDKLQRKIVPLSLQILMENAIKHNIVSSEKPLRVDVSCENGKLVVSNNVQKKNQLTESTGIGLDNIRNRYRLLSELPVEVTENIDHFTVSIPLIEN
jgi:two-component system, LytTR family, sensor kinase